MKKILALLLVCTMFTGCSAKKNDTSSKSADRNVSAEEKTTSETEDVLVDDMDYNSQDNANFCVFNCNNYFLGTDAWCYFINGYTPQTDIKDGEFLEINADVTFLSGGEAGYYNDPEIKELKSETAIDFDTAVEKYHIPFISDNTSDPANISYYRNNSGTYIICRFENELRIYLNGEFAGIVPYDSIAQYKMLARNPESCDAISNGKTIPENGSDISYISLKGNEYTIDTEHIYSAIMDGFMLIENYNDLPAEPFTAEFEKKCKTDGLFAKLYLTQGLDFEMYGNDYDVDYFVVCSENPDGKAYISINGEDMKEYPVEAAETLKSLMH